MMMTNYVLFSLLFSGALVASNADEVDEETSPIIVTSGGSEDDDDMMHLFKNVQEFPKFAMALGKLADKLVGQGKADEARTYYSRAIDILEKAPPQESSSLEIDLAGLYERLAAALLPEDVDEAARALESAIDYVDSALVDQDHRYARLLATLASCYSRQGKKEVAEETLERALRVPSPSVHNSPRIAMDRASMLRVAANVYESEGIFEKAIPLYLESVELRERFLPPNSVDLATSLHDVGRVLVSESLYDQAENFLDRAKLIFESINHPDLPIFLATSADCKQRQLKFDDARVLYQRAIHVRQARNGPDDDHVSTLRQRLVSLEETVFSNRHSRFSHAMRIASVVLLMLALCGLTFAQHCQVPEPPSKNTKTTTPKSTLRSPTRKQSRNSATIPKR